MYVDAAKAGEVRFCGGEVDLMAVCRPGERQILTLLVVALPLKGVLISCTDTASAPQIKGDVARRGPCGDGADASIR